jgi:hypothetical protein
MKTSIKVTKGNQSIELVKVVKNDEEYYWLVLKIEAKEKDAYRPNVSFRA